MWSNSSCYLSLRPEQRFLDEVHEDKTEEIHQWKIILKRDNSSDDQVCMSSCFYSCVSLWNFVYNWNWVYSISVFDLLLSLQSRLHPLREKQSKSMEEREEDYQRARDRIFNQEVRQGDGVRKTERQIWHRDRLSNFSVFSQPLCTQESTHAETR